jgi:predicted nucleic acid-binding protein
LLAVPFFEVTEGNRAAAEEYARYLHYYKNPSLIVRKRISRRLHHLLKKDTRELPEKSEDIIEAIDALETSIFESSVTEVQTAGIVASKSVPESERSIVDAYKSPNAPIIRQMIDDRCLHNLVSLAQRHYTASSKNSQSTQEARTSVLRRLVALFKSLVFEF